MSKQPVPEAKEVRTRQVEGGLFALRTFAGEANPAVVDEQRATLKQKLEEDSVAIEDPDKWLLARYNDPSTKPKNRRNEVLIPLASFDLWSA